jgi:spermidine synthase
MLLLWVKMIILLVLFCLAVVMYYFFGTQSNIKVLHHAIHPHLTLWVYEDKQYRYLSFVRPGKETQTCIDLQDPERVVYAYQKIILSSLFLLKKPERLCLIGLGGGSLAVAISKLFPNAIIDNVELNPEVLECAKNFFDFKETEKMRVYLEDGVRYLKDLHPDALYDAIIVDAFDRCYIPKDFLTTEFVGNLYRHLKPQGLALLNSFRHAPSAERELKLYQNSFDRVENLTIPFFLEGNRVLLSIKGEVENFQCIKRRVYQSIDRVTQLGIPAEKILSVLISLKIMQ